MDQTVGAGIVGLILIVVELVITTIIGLVIKKQGDKRQKEKAELEELREQRRVTAENQRCELVKTTIHQEIVKLEKDLTEKSDKRYNNLKEDISEVGDDLDLMKKTMQKDTRRSLRQDAKLYVKRGGITGQEKTEYDELYWCYHNLGKNGVVDSDHEKVMHLPEREPEGE